MPAGVVDHLELIEIQIKQRVLGRRGVGGPELHLQLRLECAAVVQAGQFVVGGLVQQLLGVLALAADVVQYQHRPDCRARMIVDQRDR